jgi:putative ATP-dependent endonuclease of OLD family
MKVTKLSVKNYKNLDDINIDLDDNCNFIVGENNLGKSNLLDLFKIIFSNRSFEESDFMDASIAISIELTIKLDDIELGNFEDLCDGNDTNTINIICKQETVDDNIEFHHKETDIFIPASRIRAANFIHYNSLRNPIQEVQFGKSKGVSRFLNNIIQKYLKDNSLTNSDFLHEDKIVDLLGFVNENISKIQAFSDFDINAVSDNQLEHYTQKVLNVSGKTAELLNSLKIVLKIIIL